MISMKLYILSYNVVLNISHVHQNAYFIFEIKFLKEDIYQLKTYMYSTRITKSCVNNRSLL
jgi:hypothetical protein